LVRARRTGRASEDSHGQQLTRAPSAEARLPPL
jgi:hypothetical protein